MSNVVKSASSTVSTTQFAVVGKIYEELFTDSSGNTQVRYLMMVKAAEAIVAGDLVGCNAAGAPAMRQSGSVTKIAAAGVDKALCAGVSLSTLATNEYGWAVCQGIVENMDGGASIAIGDLLQSTTTAGQVDTITVGAGTSRDVIGMALTATDSSGDDLNLTAYINVL